MKLDCGITEVLRSDFGSLWKCKQSGETLEISTPYLMPDSTLFTAFLTKRNNRYIVCDGGGVSEILQESCDLPSDEIKSALDGIAQKFTMKQGIISGEPLFFKECSDPKIISSLVFDVASFAVSATNALVAMAVEDEGGVQERRFRAKADDFVKSVTPSGWEFRPKRINEVPGYTFGAVIARASRLCLISYVTGSTTTYFRRSVCDTAKSFAHAWKGPLAESKLIHRTIPIIDTGASGYKQEELQWQLDELQADSHNSLVDWKEKERYAELLEAAA